jgi:hypothetical protein
LEYSTKTISKQQNKPLKGLKMRTETIEVFKFEELSDSAKETARNWYRQDLDFAWSDENLDSIKAFCDHFGIHLKNWEVSPYSSPSYSVELANSNFRGLKLKDFNRDNMPTGYCLDCDLWMTFYDQFKATGCAKTAFDAALWAGFIGWRNDMESQLSDESIDDNLIINEYEFLECGKFHS